MSSTIKSLRVWSSNACVGYIVGAVAALFPEGLDTWDRGISNKAARTRITRAARVPYSSEQRFLNKRRERKEGEREMALLCCYCMANSQHSILIWLLFRPRPNCIKPTPSGIRFVTSIDKRCTRIKCWRYAGSMTRGVGDTRIAWYGCGI